LTPPFPLIFSFVLRGEVFQNDAVAPEESRHLSGIIRTNIAINSFSKVAPNQNPAEQ
jgi:hypothetical protein